MVCDIAQLYNYMVGTVLYTVYHLSVGWLSHVKSTSLETGPFAGPVYELSFHAFVLQDSSSVTYYPSNIYLCSLPGRLKICV